MATVRLDGGGISLEFEYTMETFSHGINITLESSGNPWDVPDAVDKWSFEPLALAFPIVVDPDNSAISDTSTLNNLISDLYRASIPEKEKRFGEVFTLTVGNWYSAKGYITQLMFDHQAPFDSQGVPMRVEATIHFTPVMVREVANGAETRRPIFRSEFNGIDRMY